MAEQKQEIAELRAEVRKLKKRLTFTIDITKVEVWTEIDVAPEYMISSFGRVRRSRDDFYPKIWLDKQGYYRVSVGKYSYLLHRLIAQAFIPNPLEKRLVEHIDGDKQNNSILNLRWSNGCTSNPVRNRPTIAYYESLGKYVAHFYIGGYRNLGSFDTLEEANAAYEEARREYL